MRRYFREPISGLTHLIGALLSIAALWKLISVAFNRYNIWYIVSFAVFGISLILLYSSSAIYHLVKASPRILQNLRRLDHTMIYVLIAGTYTPFCLGPLRGTRGLYFLAAIWFIAFLGILFSIFHIKAPRWIAASLYLGMGWAAVAVAKPLWQTLNQGALIWLAMGGFFYSFGALIYIFKRPNPFPGIFGFHEIWHLFVLAGSLSHFASVIQL